MRKAPSHLPASSTLVMSDCCVATLLTVRAVRGFRRLGVEGHDRSLFLRSGVVVGGA